MTMPSRHRLLPMVMMIVAMAMAFMVNPSLCAYQNVTTLLRNHPSCSSFNTLLTNYGVASAINSRTTITVLCPPNAATDAFFSASRLSDDRETVFNVLSFHVLLDYSDPSSMAL
mgnify:CR=1 FL=1